MYFNYASPISIPKWRSVQITAVHV